MILTATIISLITFAIIAWRDFSLGIALFIVALPSYLIRFSFGPLPTTALELLFLILVGIWLIKKKSITNIFHSFRKASKQVFFFPGLLLIIGASISILFAVDTMAALGIWKAYFIEPFLFYIILSNALKTKKEWIQIWIALGGLVLTVSAVAFFQASTGLYLPTWEWSVLETRRVTSFFTSPNALGLLIGPIFIFYFGWLMYSIKQRDPNAMLRFFQLTVLLIGATAIRYSVSRGAMIAIGFGLLYLLWRSWSKKGVLVIACGLLLVAVLIPGVRTQVRGIASFQVDSGQSRLALYTGTIELLKQSPLAGLGLASFADRFEEVRQGGFTEELIYPHNIFLNFWSETGLIGLVALCWFIFICVKISWGRNEFGFIDLYLAALLVMFVHGLVDVNYFKNDLAMLTWVFLTGMGNYRL